MNADDSLRLRALRLTVFLLGWLAQLLAEVRKRLPRSLWGGAPLPGDETVDADWLSGVLGVEVQSVELTAAKTAGMVAAMAVMTPTYGGGHSSDDEIARKEGRLPMRPSRLFLKRSSDGHSARAGVILSGNWREARFYRSPLAASALSGGRAADDDQPALRGLPRIYYASGSALLGEYVMVMEDLRASRAEPCSVALIFGNQVWGVPSPLPQAERDQLATLQHIFAAAAQQHAAHWRDERLLQQRWLKAAAWLRGEERGSWQLGMTSAQRSFQRAMASGLADRIQLSDKLVRIIQRSFEASSWEALQKHWQGGRTPWTLCHGDFHCNNMLLVGDGSAEGSAIVQLDWSEVGPWEGTTDLGQLLISDVPADLFVPAAESLVRGYWQRLIAAGVDEDDYSWDACWDAFCRGGVERWIWVFSIMAAFPLPPHFVQYLHDQLLAFVEAFGGERESYILKPCIAMWRG